MNFSIRLAVLDDVHDIEDLMKRSMKILGVGHYSEAQIDSCCQFVCVPDKQLIVDQTYFVVKTESGRMVGCGGWSFRNKLYAGPSDGPQKSDLLDPLVDSARIRAMFIDPEYSGQGIGTMILEHAEQAAAAQGFLRGALGSTMSGFAFYKSKGWAATREEQAMLPNGIAIGVIQMEKIFTISDI